MFQAPDSNMINGMYKLHVKYKALSKHTEFAQRQGDASHLQRCHERAAPNAFHAHFENFGEVLQRLAGDHTHFNWRGGTKVVAALKHERS